MPDPTPPTRPITTTAAAGIDPHRAPRTLTHADIRSLDGVDFAALPALRNQTLVRYDGVWWVADRDGYTEITSTDHNHRLDRWHERLTHGALWT